MHTFTQAEPKAQLSRLIALVEAGEDVTIPKRGQAVAEASTLSVGEL
jgi:antitoxin (DNA-binding transcriptional repressor) of toxin-antitoxin stability system